MKVRGLTLVELLVAIIVSSIILTAMVSMFLVSNIAFRGGRDISEMSEDVRNAITTLDFIFSRWGVGVPCLDYRNDNKCNIQDTIQPCLEAATLPSPGQPKVIITDPMCMTVLAGQAEESAVSNSVGMGQDLNVTFYANLYGFGFVESIQNNQARIISCRLNSSTNQNCYYLWDGGKIKTGFDSRGLPIPVRLPSFNGQPDCMISPSVNLTLPISLNTVSGGSVNLSEGDYISRAPHKITLRVQTIDGKSWLFMDRVDMSSCNDNSFGENAVRIGRVLSPQHFHVRTEGRSVRVDVTFVSADGRKYEITRYYGR